MRELELRETERDNLEIVNACKTPRQHFPYFFNVFHLCRLSVAVSQLQIVDYIFIYFIFDNSFRILNNIKF